MNTCKNTRLGGLQVNVENIFDQLFQTTSPRAHTPWAPVAEITESEKEYVLTLELPGVSSDEISIEMQDNEIVISGEKKLGEPPEGTQRLRQERRGGTFRRSFEFATLINADAVSASFEDGVLNIQIPKSEKVLPKRIEISTRKQ